jgi:cysteinyl-tRNA synthetase
MALRLYNTLTNQKEDFRPVVEGKVGMYVCGPTVYKDSHIGHAVGPVIFDAFKKFLVHQGYAVKFVINITDVDDKIILESQKRGMGMGELAEEVMGKYFECLAELGVDSVDEFPQATEHISHIVKLIERLMAKDAAYAVEGDVYFDVTRDGDYGKLSNRRTEDQAQGGRELAGKEKRNPGDFALWKSANADEIGWDAPWGRGRPGWHIECSAMSMEHLGETFDIHGGGIDLLFPHHENEIAQSETATDKPFANYWMHNGLTRMRTKAASGEWKNEKMSKSIGNIKPIKELLVEYSATTLRFYLLSTHYRSPIDFSDEAIRATEKGMMGLYRVLERVGRLSNADIYQGHIEAEGSDELIEQATAARKKFVEALEDDFNTAGALSELFEMSSHINRTIESNKLETATDEAAIGRVVYAARTITELGQIVGLLSGPLEKSGDTDGLADQLMQVLIGLRATARAQKNFAMSDAIRDRLGELNITLEDRADGTVWSQQ